MERLENKKAKSIHQLQRHLKVAFNSPFYPFVLATTPIAQEGLNFQNYAHRIFHWRLPVSPIDFEQREGRINRYRSHAVRKSLVQNYIRENDRPHGERWVDLFDQAQKGNSGLSPDWIPLGNNRTKIQSCIVTHKFSKERVVQDALRIALNNYRLSLGYGVTNCIFSN